MTINPFVALERAASQAKALHDIAEAELAAKVRPHPGDYRMVGLLEGRARGLAEALELISTSPAVVAINADDSAEVIEAKVAGAFAGVRALVDDLVASDG